MSTQNIIRKLIGIQDVNIKEVKETEKNIEIYIALNVKPHICPYCGQITTKIHDYRTQQVTDIPYRFKVINLIYRKRRYTCTNWFIRIINSCCQPITNGFTEGCNNKIKVLKRNAYGYKRFDRFKKRILFVFSNAS